MKTTRRQFIKISGMTTAGAVVAGSVLGQINKAAEKKLSRGNVTADSELTRTPTYCEVCFWKCGAWVYKDKDDRIVKLVGNENDQHARGKLCPRGTGGLGMYYDEDRLLKPKIRVTDADGNQSFKDVEWDEALDFVAKKMKHIEKKYGREHMALFIHGAPAKHFEYLFKAWGNENHAEPAYAQCTAGREAGNVATFGSGVGSPEPADVQNSKCITFIGNHVGENMHNSYVQEVSEAVNKGASIIVVDPRLSTIAAKAKYWLPVKPGTDIALLLSWIHVLIYENLYDKEYVDKYTYGLDYLKDHVRNNTPEWASSITGVDANLIRDAIYEMAKAAPASVVHPGRHTTWYGDDTQRARAMAIINALMGSYGRRGGIYMGVKQKIPSMPVPEFPEAEWGWKEIIKEKYKGAAVGVTNLLIEASLPDYPEEHQIKGWFIAGTSFINTIPGRDKIMKAMDNQELIVMVDTMPMEMTGYADVVLPECTYLERYDYMRAGKNRIAQVALRMPAVEPKGDSKPAWWIAREIAVRLGREKYYPWKNFEELLEWQLKQIGTSLEEMKKVGVKTFESSEPIYLLPGEDFEFNTNTGKIELYSTDLAGWGYDPMPVYKDNGSPDPGYYYLIYGRVPQHTFGRSQNNPYLHELHETNAVWVNPKTAKIWGLENGDKIWLKNQDGVVSNFPAAVRVTERIRPDAVYVAHGFGHTSKFMKKAFGKGINDIELITNVKLDPVTGGTGMRANYVTFVTEPPQKDELEIAKRGNSKRNNLVEPKKEEVES